MAKKRGDEKEDEKEEKTTTSITTERDIAMDFATKAYKKFDKIIKAAVLFGSSVKQTSKSTSDIDIILIIDDATIKWDQELIAWYREELGKLVQSNPYRKTLHINTVRLSTWWTDMVKGDPVVLNVIRYGEALIDLGGFFNPLKVLLEEGKIRATPEAIYNSLQRAPLHLLRSKASMLSSVEGLYWAMVDSAHAALIAAKQFPPSPEHITIMLKKVFVDNNIMKMRYVEWFRDLHSIHKKINHGDINSIKGCFIDEWHDKTVQFVDVMTEIVKELTES